MAKFFYEFDWDPVKERSNFSKHGLAFEGVDDVFWTLWH